MSRMRLLRKALVFLPIVLLSFTSCALCLGEWREFATGADSDLNFMVYGDSFHYEVGSGLTIQLLTAYDEDGTQFSEAGIALTVSVGPGEKDEETINLTGKEPPGGFKEEWDRGMAWLRYWEAEEFFIPERAANVDWWRPWPLKYEESLRIPRFIFGPAEEGRKTLSRGLYMYSLHTGQERLESPDRFPIPFCKLPLDWRRRDRDSEFLGAGDLAVHGSRRWQANLVPFHRSGRKVVKICKRIDMVCLLHDK